MLALFGLTQKIDTGFADSLMALNHHLENSDLTVVEIDPTSIRELNNWPWPRRYHADIVTALFEAGAETVAFDIDFSSHSDSEMDLALSRALQQAPPRRVILPAFSQPLNSNNGNESGPMLWTKPIPQLARYSQLATVNVTPDSDGIVRNILPNSGKEFDSVPTLSEVFHARSSTLPNEVRVDYSIGVESFDNLSYSDVLRGTFPRELVAGRKILIGATAVELGDRFSTPVHASLPGVYIQALAYQTLKHPFITTLEPIRAAFVLLGFLILHAVLLGDRRWLLQLGISTALILLVAAMSHWAFREFRLLLPSGAFIAGLVLLQALSWLESLDRQSLALLQQGLRLRHRTSMMKSIVHNSMDAILAVDEKGVINSANPAAALMFGCDQERLQGVAIDTLLPDWSGIESSLSEGSRIHTSARQSGNKTLQVELSLGVVDDSDHRQRFLMVRDITQQYEYERRLHYKANHDSLTGLLNRRSIESRLLEMLENGADRLAFLLLDLNNFKEINDTLGHPTGDDVLRKMAGRMSMLQADDCIIGRIGGDEFGVIYTGADDAAELAERLLEKVREPLVLGEMTVGLSASIGISRFPDDAATATELVQHADVAMYLAKELKCGQRAYDAEADRHSLRRLTIISQLREALSGEQFYLVYQPKVQLHDGKTAGAEALIRWQHPELGFISPGEFIPIAEQIGVIEDITEWLVDETLQFIHANDQLLAGLTVAINISARSLTDKNFPEKILSRIHHFGVEASRLALEVTETAVIQDPGSAMTVLQTLSDAGIIVEIDDFGTGYSSMSYLSTYPAQRLKIDQSFIFDMLTCETHRTIVNASVELAHRLGMQAVAEGVENTETYRALQQMGCDYAQGYGISKPVPEAEFLEWLRGAGLASAVTLAIKG